MMTGNPGVASAAGGQAGERVTVATFRGHKGPEANGGQEWERGGRSSHQ